MIWAALGGFAVGLVIAEYYHHKEWKAFHKGRGDRVHRYRQ